jgi:hypothetical protein
VIAPGANKTSTLFAWGPSTVGVQQYSYIGGTWAAVYLPSSLLNPGGMTSGLKGSTFLLDSSSHPYHLNVYAGYIGAQRRARTTNAPDSNFYNVRHQGLPTHCDFR